MLSYGRREWPSWVICSVCPLLGLSDCLIWACKCCNQFTAVAPGSLTEPVGAVKQEPALGPLPCSLFGVASSCSDVVCIGHPCLPPVSVIGRPEGILAPLCLGMFSPNTFFTVDCILSSNFVRTQSDGDRGIGSWNWKKNLSLKLGHIPPFWVFPICWMGLRRLQHWAWHTFTLTFCFYYSHCSSMPAPFPLFSVMVCTVDSFWAFCDHTSSLLPPTPFIFFLPWSCCWVLGICGKIIYPFEASSQWACRNAFLLVDFLEQEVFTAATSFPSLPSLLETPVSWKVLGEHKIACLSSILKSQ